MADRTTTFQITVDRGPDIGQNFGSLFEAASEDGSLVVGAGFQNCYNTRNRADRHALQFFIHWRKPELGLHEFQGSRANNIVLSPEWAEMHKVAIGGPAIFRDESPAAAPDGRYETFITSRSPLGMRPFKSPGGLVWSPMSDGPTITAGAFDSQNLAFWDSARGEYRAYWRIFTKGVTNETTWKPEGVRAIRTATSKDLLHRP